MREAADLRTHDLQRVVVAVMDREAVALRQRVHEQLERERAIELEIRRFGNMNRRARRELRRLLGRARGRSHLPGLAVVLPARKIARGGLQRCVLEIEAQPQLRIGHAAAGRGWRVRAGLKWRIRLRFETGREATRSDEQQCELEHRDRVEQPPCHA